MSLDANDLRDLDEVMQRLLREAIRLPRAELTFGMSQHRVIELERKVRDAYLKELGR